ncbi:Metal-dependent hydrolase, endonuclease/exonuclease/phosphatase family [Streptomyces sp. SolWspMP-sol7th]|nr:Metal-dependent hydrolase, endonuclease/exonuclease/phosphatase family [Streptomyces sp. SolWspMP-sol7th]
MIMRSSAYPGVFMSWSFSRRLRRLGAVTAALLLCLSAHVLSATVAAADTVEPGSAPPLRSISYNVCGASAACRSELDLPSWTAIVTGQARDWNADSVMLQELCHGQWESLRDALPGYQGVWTKTVDAPGCAKWSGDTGFGLGLFVKSPAVDRFSANLTVPTGQEPRAVLCARGPVQGRTTLTCTTHLAQYITPDNGSAQALAHIDSWAAGLPVTLGGDFNAGPQYAALDPLRAGTPGTGPFAEADENDRDYFTAACLEAGATTCRSGEPTAGGQKFDHVFLSARDFRTVRADAVQPDTGGAGPLSDHLLLRAAAAAESRAPSGVAGDLTGDGRPDLLAVKDDGVLRLYPGLADGRVGTPRIIGLGGWQDAAVSHRGDWTGDGREDVVARVGDALWVYPNTGSGELGKRLAMGGRPTGWTNALPLAAGDVDGDGLPDLLARSSTGLWLHRGAAAEAGNPSFAARAAVRIGGPEWAGYDVLLPGDMDEDGRADVEARDRATGRLLAYPSRGAEPLPTPRQLTGEALPTAARRLLVSPGDVTGDGSPDLWSTVASGGVEDLQILPGTATGTGTARTVGAGGWQWINSLG